jgi:hypothetical protein
MLPLAKLHAKLFDLTAAEYAMISQCILLEQILFSTSLAENLLHINRNVYNG